MAKRILLRELATSDAAFVISLLTDSDVMEFIGPRRALSKDEAVQWFLAELKSPSRYAVALCKTNQLIGFCGMKVVDGINDFGYFFTKDYWGQGFATEACILAIEKLSETVDLAGVQIFIAKQNRASLNIAKKLRWLQVCETVKNNEPGYSFQMSPY